jgi:hypothetical protein
MRAGQLWRKALQASTLPGISAWKSGSAASQQNEERSSQIGQFWRKNKFWGDLTFVDVENIKPIRCRLTLSSSA